MGWKSSAAVFLAVLIAHFGFCGETPAPTGGDAAAARAARMLEEKLQPGRAMPAPLAIKKRDKPPVIDGKLDDWDIASMTSVPENKNKNYGFVVALAADAERLYGAWIVSGGIPLLNMGGDWKEGFRTGGGVDLHLRTEFGDIRIFLTEVDGKVQAVLYRVADPASKEPVEFVSTVDRVAFASVTRLEGVSLATEATREGYIAEVAIPLKDFGLAGWKEKRVLGDIGVVYSDPDGTKGLIRSYWSNKATGVTVDLPTEAWLEPGRWGWIGIE